MTIFSANSGSFNNITSTGLVSASSFKGDGSEITSVAFANISGLPTLISSSTQVTDSLPTGVISSSTQLPSGIASSSAQVTAYLPTDVVSSSAQVTAFLPTGTVSSSGQVSYLGLSNIPSGIASGSTQVKVYLPTDTVSSSAQVISFLPTGTVSSSTQINTGSFTGSFVGDGSGLTGIASTLTFSGSTGSDTLNLKTEALNIVGSNGITTTVTDNNITLNLPTSTVSSSAQVTAFLPNGTVSSSVQIDITATTGYNTFSSSISSENSSQNNVLNALNSKTGSYATTGSNTFQGSQVITGSLTISENLTVLGSSSIEYISQSTLNIGTNLITVNAQNPSVRFGGLAVLDSGSSPLRSGSLLFDSIKDEFIFVHQSAGVTSSVLLLGPETYSDIGNEIYLSTNRVPKGSGNEHLIDSQISDNGTTVGMTGNLSVTGSITSAQMTASAGFFGTASYATTAGFALTPAGTSGTSGTAGSSGSSGASGTSGTAGSSGSGGSSGSSGASGTSGTSGANGTSGTSGANGSSGTAGSSGTSGANGANGTSGVSGTSGTSGANGANGSSGTSGAGTISGGAANRVAVFSGATTLTSNANFTFDGTALQITGSTPYFRALGSVNYSYLDLSDGTSTGYLIKNVSSGTGNGALAGALYTYTDNNKAFQHLHSGTPLFTILSTGNVGIGTTGPGYKLDVTGDIRATTNITVGSAVIHNTTSTRDKYRVYDSDLYAIGMQSGITFGGLNDWGMTFQFNDENDRGFWWGDSTHTTGQGAMALTTNGYLTVANLIRVGYGESDTTDPTSTTRFDVAGSTGQLFSVVDSSTGTLMAVNDSSGMPILEVTSSDEVIVTGTLYCTGEITAYYSDERLKNRMGRIENALDAILSLSGFKYTANELAVQNGYKDTGVQIGLSAQEVQKVLPELVKLAAFDVEHDDNGNQFSKTGANYLTLDYVKLVPVLVEAIKEQQKRIEKLENIILQKNEG